MYERLNRESKTIIYNSITIAKDCNTLHFKILAMSKNQFSVLQYQQPLKSYALTLTKDQESASDLLQETMYRAFKNRDKFTMGTNLKGWLYTIMRNIFINNYRSRKRRQVVFDSSDNQYLLDSNAGASSNAAEGAVLHDEIKALVSNLREDYRVPFMMAYQGHKYDDIAQQLDVPLGTIKSRIFLARKTLKAEIKKTYRIDHIEELVA